MLDSWTGISYAKTSMVRRKVILFYPYDSQ